MRPSGSSCRLRAVEPGDAELIYAWENDPALWPVSGTVAPFSRYVIGRFIERGCDIWAERQMRLMIETAEGRTVGAVDLFEFDPLHLRAGVGIAIYAAEDRRKGYASEALVLLESYARDTLRLHQLWCGVGAGNAASLALFRRAGFVESGRRRDWLSTPDGWCDEIEFQKIL
ncbi:MAG: GNAT family N-acetyltransferase [Alistipes sp.]|nr:GNAT family N-acetyltransferase [Alistipes sp.]